MHVTGLALTSCRNVQKWPQTLPFSDFPYHSPRSMVPSSYPLSSGTSKFYPPPFHNTALPTILAANLGCRPESISTIPSLLEVLPVGGEILAPFSSASPFLPPRHSPCQNAKWPVIDGRGFLVTAPSGPILLPYPIPPLSLFRDQIVSCWSLRSH